MADLSKYHEKRNFEETPEPKGEIKQVRGHFPLFVVQYHEARSKHYDFRLEYDGVLLSWAVPKGPSTNPADKRLAVRTEDHPYEYAYFEGEIPKGNYGAGTVRMWDIGGYEPLCYFKSGLEKGYLKFRLYGEMLEGVWTLRKMRNSENPDNWLLIKENDK